MMSYIRDIDLYFAYMKAYVFGYAPHLIDIFDAI